MVTILTDEGGNKVRTCESKFWECVGIPGALVLERGKDRNDVEPTWANTLRACKIEAVCALSRVRCRKFFVLEAVGLVRHRIAPVIPVARLARISAVPRGAEM